MIEIAVLNAETNKELDKEILELDSNQLLAYEICLNAGRLCNSLQIGNEGVIENLLDELKDSYTELRKSVYGDKSND